MKDKPNAPEVPEKQHENFITQARYLEFKGEFDATYFGSATEYRDEVLRRLGPQDPLTPTETINLVWGDKSGARFITIYVATKTAEYLDQLARKLPQ